MLLMAIKYPRAETDNTVFGELYSFHHTEKQIEIGMVLIYIWINYNLFCVWYFPSKKKKFKLKIWRKFDEKKAENCLHGLTQFVFLKKKYFNEQNHTQRIWFLFVIGIRCDDKVFFFNYAIWIVGWCRRWQ